MSSQDEDAIRFYRDAVIAGHDAPAAETMRHFNLSRDYTVRLLNGTIAGCEGQISATGSPKNAALLRKSPELRTPCTKLSLRHGRLTCKSTV